MVKNRPGGLAKASKARRQGRREVDGYNGKGNCDAENTTDQNDTIGSKASDPQFEKDELAALQFRVTHLEAVVAQLMKKNQRPRKKASSGPQDDSDADLSEEEEVDSRPTKKRRRETQDPKETRCQRCIDTGRVCEPIPPCAVEAADAYMAAIEADDPVLIEKYATILREEHGIPPYDDEEEEEEEEQKHKAARAKA